MQERNTYQKLKILESLKKVKTHPTAEMLYKDVSKDIPTITLATVYRNLNLLAKKQKIMKLEINGEYHFDGDICNHQHAVCTICSKIIDIFQEEISKYALDKIKKNKFKPSCVNIIYKGICKDCWGKNDNN
jgi:Fur family transcriptional regulator, peroxide stress response regulator